MSRHFPAYQIQQIGEAESEELEKIAINVKGLLGLGRVGKGLRGSSANTGRLVGALGGAALGAGTGAAVDSEDRTRGAILGALGGAALGTGAGQFATKAGRTQAGNLGLRQLHGFTGYLPGQGFKSISKMKPEERVAALKKINWTMPKTRHAVDSSGKLTSGALEKLKKQIDTESIGDGTGIMAKVRQSSIGKKWRDSKPREALLKLRMMRENADRDLIEQGLTSIPGAIRGYALGKGGTNLTRIQQLKSNLLAPGLALGVGLPAVSLVGSGVNYSQTGDEKQLAKDLVDTAGYSIMAGLPFLPAIATGEALSYGTGKLLGKKAPPEEPVEAMAPTQAARLKNKVIR